MLTTSSCERENKWLEEAPFAVDTDYIPRGGHRRRKSMEPKALTNRRGSLVDTEFSLKASQQGQKSAMLSPSKEFLDLGTPPAQSTNSATTSKTPARATFSSNVPITPVTYVDASFFGDSPTTPYFLHPQQLVQQTCPPKQTQQSFFAGKSDTGEEKTAAAVKQRLALMRRRSLQYQPAKPSPLGLGVDV